MWLTSMVCQRKQPSGPHVCCVHVRVLRETAAIHVMPPNQTAGPCRHAKAAGYRPDLP
jgi:hypothetical protein